MAILNQKSQKVITYLYRCSIEKTSTEIIEMLPYGKMGMLLFEVAKNIYQIINETEDEDRDALLGEVQALSESEINQIAVDLSNDINMINHASLNTEEKQEVVHKIYHSLKSIPKHNVHAKAILKSINEHFFDQKDVFSIKHTYSRRHHHLTNIVVKTLMNSKIHFDAQKIDQLSEYPEIEGFKIKGFLGEGAYAKVYLAHQKIDTELPEICALKIGALENEARFSREVENMQKIKHQNVLTCWHSGQFQNPTDAKMYYWISMPNMGGLTLEDLMRSGQLRLEDQLLLLMQLINGLEALHCQGVIHRDLKPSNCLISSDFDLKISDFGLSKDINANIDSTGTQKSIAIGTPAYMSPEHINMQNISSYSDIWSFGMIAYEMFRGDLPWGREIKPLVLTGNIQHLEIDVKELSKFGISNELIEMIGICLKKDFSKRYQDASQLRIAFETVAKAERAKLRYQRFKSSWQILFEQNLLEKFIDEQVSNDRLEALTLNDFLDFQAIVNISINLDDERMDDLFKALSIQIIDLNITQINEDQKLQAKEKIKNLLNLEIKQEKQSFLQNHQSHTLKSKKNSHHLVDLQTESQIDHQIKQNQKYPKNIKLLIGIIFFLLGIAFNLYENQMAEKAKIEEEIKKDIEEKRKQKELEDLKSKELHEKNKSLMDRLFK